MDSILLGRLGLNSSEAIEAYQKLEPALSVGPAKDDEERKRNSEAFEAAFREVLSDAGFEADAPMITTDTTKARTSVASSTWNAMLIDPSEWFVPRVLRISPFYIPFAPNSRSTCAFVYNPASCMREHRISGQVSACDDWEGPSKGDVDQCDGRVSEPDQRTA